VINDLQEVVFRENFPKKRLLGGQEH